MRRRKFLKSMGTGSLAAMLPSAPGGLGTNEQEVYPPGQQKGRRTQGHMDPWIEVDLGRIAWNFSRVRNHVKVPVMAVVKANAYGHGLVDVSRALQKAGALWLMTGKLQEAAALREAKISCPVLNFGPFNRQDGAEIVEQNIGQSVYSEEVAILDAAAAQLRKKASVHVDIDTGMGRTGVPFDRALPFIRKTAALPNIRIDGLSTTLTEDLEFDREQLRRLLEVCSAARANGIPLGLRHAASSAAILGPVEFCLDMVRPGITLYGYYPNAQTQKEDVLDLKPALKLRARVVFVKDLEPGDSLSYHRSVKVQTRMRAATVGIGYADGYPPQLGGKGMVIIRNKKFPVLNAVTANHTMVDLGGDREIQTGDEVTLIDSEKNSELTVDRLAEQSGISGYKILIGLNPLIPRVFQQNGPGFDT